MGRLSNPIYLQDVISYFNIYNYVETGFGDGTSLKDVYNVSPQLKFYGIDLDLSMCDRLANSDLGSVVKIYNGYSKDQFIPLLDDLNDDPTLFWLDAHFPNSDYHGVPYNSEPDDSKRIPLKIELEILKNKRDISKDVIIMDDLRIYVDRNYEAGSWEFRAAAGADGYEFIEEILDDTHLLLENYKDQGYLLAFPRSSNLDIVKSFIKEY